MPLTIRYEGGGLELSDASGRLIDLNIYPSSKDKEGEYVELELPEDENDFYRSKLDPPIISRADAASLWPCLKQFAETGRFIESEAGYE